MTFDGLIAHTAPLVGRGDEVEQIARLFARPGRRLVTLLGPGGIGKTRLAVHAAEQLAGHFIDGWRFVSCVPVTTPDFIAPTIAESIGLTLFGTGDPSDQVIAYLRDRSMLLVIDNFDHLTEHAELLGRIAEQVRSVQLIVTTRERLGLAAETTLHVRGLAFPAGDSTRDLETYDAALLFLQSAHRINPELTFEHLGSQNVARVCQLVEGMPLALELAASWIRMMSCADLVRELEERSLQLLNARRKDRPDRHASIQVTFDYTWDRLTEVEQHVFQRLTVFRGFFDRKAAEDIAGATVAVLSNLVDKSLVRYHPQSGFDLHELLRQYGYQKLVLDDQARLALEERHSAYYANLLADLEQQLYRGDDMVVLQAIDQTLRNVQAGWQFAIEHSAALNIERFSLCVSYFSGATGLYRYAHGLFDNTVEALRGLAESEERDRALARALIHSGMFRQYAGDSAGAIQILNESLQMLSKLEDSPQQDSGFARCFLGVTLGIYQDYAEAQRTLDEAIRIFESLGTEGKFGLTIAVGFSGETALQHGDFALARSLSERALAICRTTNLRAAAQPILPDIVMACLGMGETKAAKSYLRNEVDWEETDWLLPMLFYMLTATILTLIQLGQPVHAVEILATSMDLPFGDWEYDIRSKPTQDALKMLRSRLPKDVFAAAWKRGKVPILLPREEFTTQRLNPEFAKRVKWMLDQADAPPASRILTTRELEVVRCLERGLSNDGIAAELVISEATVKRHIHHIFGKLDVRNRTQAVSRARELGLL